MCLRVERKYDVYIYTKNCVYTRLLTSHQYLLVLSHSFVNYTTYTATHPNTPGNTTDMHNNVIHANITTHNTTTYTVRNHNTTSNPIISIQTATTNAITSNNHYCIINSIVCVVASRSNVIHMDNTYLTQWYMI